MADHGTDTLPLPVTGPSRPLRAIDAAKLAEALESSRSSPRRRSNLNVHPTLEDPIQRLFNVLQPGTYVRPHRHEGDRWELFVILQGRAAVLLLNDLGLPAGSAILDPATVRAVELAGAHWHTVLALAPDTVLFEVKPGPYRALEDKDFPAWAAPEGTPEAAALLGAWEALMVNRP
jgi:cupin fold WbuC family metalloprotein